MGEDEEQERLIANISRNAEESRAIVLRFVRKMEAAGLTPTELLALDGTLGRITQDCIRLEALRGNMRGGA